MTHIGDTTTLPYIPHRSLDPPILSSQFPNAIMVDKSLVEINLTHHQRQRDEETRTQQEQQEKLAEQRQSLNNAVEIIEVWHQRDSLRDDNEKSKQAMSTNENTKQSSSSSNPATNKIRLSPKKSDLSKKKRQNSSKRRKKLS